MARIRTLCTIVNTVLYRVTLQVELLPACTLVFTWCSDSTGALYQYCSQGDNPNKESPCCTHLFYSRTGTGTSVFRTARQNRAQTNWRSTCTQRAQGTGSFAIFLTPGWVLPASSLQYEYRYSFRPRHPATLVARVANHVM